MKINNPILNTDGYKLSHADMYAPGTDGIYSYIESRGLSQTFADYGFGNEIVHFGSAIVSDQFVDWRIHNTDISQAEEILQTYGVPFNKDRWQYIVNEYGGWLPVTVLGLPDGKVVNTHTPQMVMYNKDPNLFWLVSYLETAILRTVWYGSTVATLSRNCKKIIKRYMELTCDNLDGLPFKLHDFGARGASSEEAARIGGLAHLINFMGTDTLSALDLMMDIYGESGKAFSIPASEHSTITSWGKDREVDAYDNMLTLYGKDGSIFSCVSDSYDIFNAVRNIWGGELRQKIIDSGATVVIRPDSGDPVTVVLATLEILADRFGFTTNTKGYRVLNHVRVIQGDGIYPESLAGILIAMKNNGYSVDNIAFGMGGGLLQNVNRDSLKYAMKASAVRIDGKWTPIQKDPATDHGKKSKAGLLNEEDMVTVYETINDGRLSGTFYRTESFDDVRARAAV